MQFLVVNNDGTRAVKGDPGWLIGDTPEDSRRLTEEELVDLGFGLKLIDQPPPFDPASQVLTIAPIDEWPVDERTATVTYTVTDLSPEEIRERMPTLNPAQIRLGLLSVGITEAMVEAAIGNDPASLIDWRMRPSYRRLHPLVLALSAPNKFNLPADQVDALWAWAKDL
ncbi:hypothetical protein [Mesorhizobium sp. B2-8-3]|uniref:hypothetical protein n=1 Tax=Mesorhizobium sp. B2-8-3 TaxID=2589905 RepID=UPI0011290329|nr:hypothetical protein [Mesorhizobium sp. B2-8-3]TPJ33683.1 hypothetical protein FJ418_13725 [Mesorhizobium sp. B2-8-3]